MGSEPSEHSEDRELLTRVCDGDQTALAALYDRHAARMLGLAKRLLRSQADAEDLVHDVFLEAWNQAKRYSSDRGSVAAWLTIKIRSRGLDRLRKLKVAREHGLAVARNAEEPSPREPSVAEYGCASKALQNLSAEEQETLNLAYYYGYTMKEIAKRCGIPVGTVKSRISRALAQIRQQLQTPGLRT